MGATKRDWDDKKAFLAGWRDDLTFLKVCQKTVLPLWTSIFESSALASDSSQGTQHFTQLLEELHLKNEKVGNTLTCLQLSWERE